MPIRFAVMIGLLAAGCDDPAAPPGTDPVDPPFNGTIFIDPDARLEGSVAGPRMPRE